MLDTNSIIDGFINDAWWTKENANIPYSVMSLNNKIAEAVHKQYWLTEIYDEEIRTLYKNRTYHIHNLGHLTTYCVGWNLEDVLLRGFKGQAGRQSSKPAKHFRTALGHIYNFMYTLQGESAGAQALSNFDSYLAPFIRYDGLSQKEVDQCIQEFMFNMNVPTRVGGQQPFTNITMDQLIPKFMQDDFVIVGGDYKDDVYGDFNDEMKMLNDAWWKQRILGDADGRPQPFPIETLNVTKDFNWDDELLFKAVATRGSPYFSNFINTDMNPEDVRSMCPLKGTEKVLVRTKYGLRLSEIRHIYYDIDEPIEVYSNGKWVKGLFNKYNNQDMIKITLDNNHTISVTKTHLNIIKRNKKSPIIEIVGSELQTGDYLPYSLNKYEGDGGIYETGYLVGCFAGDGSYDGKNTVVFSLNEKEKETTMKKIIEISNKLFGATYSISTYNDTELLSLKIHSNSLVGLCKDFVSNKKTEKYYNAKLYGMSLEFRKGVFDGHYDTDGGNRNRIYTSSVRMVECLNMLAATLGTTTSIQIDDRSDRYSTNPNYSVLFYKLNRNNYSDIWFKEDGYLWMKIKSIEPDYGNVGYCLEIIDDDPIFTVGSTGIITHNCRLRIDNTVLNKRGGGFFGSSPLTGSIGVVTMNLPNIAYLVPDEDAFYERLEYAMDVAKRSLELKRAAIERFTTEVGLYPYSKVYLESVYKRFGEYWKNHFSTIGLVGMNEASMNLLSEDISTDSGLRFAENTLNFMRKKLVEIQEETDNMYNLEATPAEGTSYRLAMLDRKEYPQIYTAGTKYAPYYTNSSQLPVGIEKPLGFYLKHQSKLQPKYTGGTVFHIWNGEALSHWEGISKLVKNVAHKTQLSYYTYSPITSICPVHGKIQGEYHVCPNCGSECEVWTRVTGYFSPVKQWNPGKVQEFKERIHFTVDSRFD